MCSSVLGLGERPHWGLGDGGIHLGLGWGWGFSTFLVKETKGEASDDDTTFLGRLDTGWTLLPPHSRHSLSHLD